MIKATIMPIFKTDMTILLKLCSFLWFFMFFDQNICAVEKTCPFVTIISTIIWKIWLETDVVMDLSRYLMMTHHYLVSLMIPSWRTMTIKSKWIDIVLINFHLIRRCAIIQEPLEPKVNPFSPTQLQMNGKY